MFRKSSIFSSSCFKLLFKYSCCKQLFIKQAFFCCNFFSNSTSPLSVLAIINGHGLSQVNQLATVDSKADSNCSAIYHKCIILIVAMI